MMEYVEFKCNFQGKEHISIELTIPITSIHRLQVENNLYFALIDGKDISERIWVVLNKKYYHHVRKILLDHNETVKIDKVQSKPCGSSIEQLDVT